MVCLDTKIADDILMPKSMRTRSILLALGILQLVARTAAQSGGGTRAAGAAADEAVKLEVFTVTGSNIRRVDAETALPVTVIDKSELDARGAATMAELFETLGAAEISGITELNNGPMRWWTAWRSSAMALPRFTVRTRRPA
jgi:hypothetical protein